MKIRGQVQGYNKALGNVDNEASLRNIDLINRKRILTRELTVDEMEHALVLARELAAKRANSAAPFLAKPDARELLVAALSGGQLAKNSRGADLTVTHLINGRQREAGIDVIGSGGELISVGGPNKGTTTRRNADKLLETLMHLRVLKAEARQRGTKVQMFLESGNSPLFSRLLYETRSLIGYDNVIVYPSSSTQEVMDMLIENNLPVGRR